MRKLVLACVLALLATAQGCGGGDGGSPTEPANPQPRGNWIGTISGTHADLGVQGTCTLEMSFNANLTADLNGQWWIDCPSGSRSQGPVFSFGSNNVILFTFSPLASCPWDAFGTRTATGIEGSFEVTDCATNATRSTGTFQIRPR